jgi:hypothetical protein
MKRFKVIARILPDGRTFTATGQEGRSLLLLQRKALNGIVVFDFVGGTAFRLAAYVCSIKQKHGLNIETKRELHDGGWHARYVLHTPIEIISTESF